MGETSLAGGAFSYRGLFPWLHLFRAFHIAVDLRKMTLAGLGLICISAGQWCIGQLPFVPDVNGATEQLWPWQTPLGKSNPLDVPQRILSDPAETLWDVATNWQLVLRPARDFVEPAWMLFQPDLNWSTAAYAWTTLLLTLLVWALFGGAITRIAAVQFARDERIGIWTALKFAAGKLLSFLTAPLLAVGGIGFFWLLCVGGGFLIGRILPYAGALIVGALWIVPLALSVLMALILIGVAAGWPLMFAAISAEGSDAFDGLGRSFSYVYDRPWHYLWFGLVSVVYGSVIIVFVTLLFSLVVYLAGWSVGGGMGMDQVGSLYSAAPEHLGGTERFAPPQAVSSPLGVRFTQVWLHVVAVLQIGFVYSYFWTAATIIYFLLRQSDDATDLDEVYLPQQTEVDELLPLVGVAASDQPVIQRPPSGAPPSVIEEETAQSPTGTRAETDDTTMPAE